jgi:hypothetical protein
VRKDTEKEREGRRGKTNGREKRRRNEMIKG